MVAIHLQLLSSGSQNLFNFHLLRVKMLQFITQGYIHQLSYLHHFQTSFINHLEKRRALQERYDTERYERELIHSPIKFIVAP